MRSIKNYTFIIIWVTLSLFIGATSFMPQDIYSGVWWKIFWGIILFGVIIIVLNRKMYKRAGVFMLHLALIFIIAGGELTSILCKTGTIHLKPGEVICDYINHKGETESLPFKLALKDFEIENYHGMSFPRDYRTTVVIDGREELKISMNKIGKKEGWRFYQTSYDNEGGSILSVSYDLAGMALTYFGFFIFALSGLYILIKGAWGKRPKKAAIFLPIIFISLKVCAAPAIPEGISDSLELRAIEFNGRVMPYISMATDVTYKLTGKNRVGELSATRFITSLIVYGEGWLSTPFIKIKNRELLKILKGEGGYVSLSSLYDENGEYIPQRFYKGGEGELDSEILKLDEKVAIAGSLMNGSLFCLPDANEKIDYGKIKSEYYYVKVEPVKYYFMLMFLSGLILITYSLFGKKDVRAGVTAMNAIIFLCGACIFVWRWTIVGYMPLSRSDEIMFFVSVIISGLSIILGLRNVLMSGVSQLTGGFFALVSWLGVKDPTLTPLMPVLASPWLAIHVATVMISYAILSLTLPISLIGLCFPKKMDETGNIIKSLIGPGVYILGLGIITGSMWANVSWGRYWAWDPKETWALVTFLLYAASLHKSTGLRDNKGKFFHIYIIFSFLSIIMTYFGVNYLTSLHSYQ